MTATPAATDRTFRATDRMLMWIDRMTERDERRYAVVRSHQRKSFNAPILVCITTPEHMIPGEHHPFTYPGIAFNISQGGVGFLMQETINAEVVQLGLKLPDGSYRWKQGRVVRLREVPGETFVEYGVAFGTPK